MRYKSEFVNTKIIIVLSLSIPFIILVKYIFICLGFAG